MNSSLIIQPQKVDGFQNIIKLSSSKIVQSYDQYQEQNITNYKQMLERHDFTMVDGRVLSCSYQHQNLVIRVKQLKRFIPFDHFLQKNNQCLSQNEIKVEEDDVANDDSQQAETEKFFQGRFPYSSLPNKCKLDFKSAKQISQAFKYAISSVISKGQSIQVHLKSSPKQNDRGTEINCTLHFSLSENFEYQPNGKVGYIKLEEISEQKIQTTNESFNKNEEEPKMDEIDDDFQINLEFEEVEDECSWKQVLKTCIQNNTKLLARLNEKVEFLKEKQQLFSNQIEMLCFQRQLSHQIQQPVTIRPLKYKFSIKRRHQSPILVSLSQIICKAQRDSQYHYMMLIEPEHHRIKITHTPSILSLRMHILDIRDYLAIGMCSKRKAQQMKYSCHKDSSNHGSYLLDWSGVTWSSFLSSEINQYQQLKFRNGDFIRMEFNTRTLKLRFIHEMTSFQTAIQIRPGTQLDDFTFCVYIGGYGDSIQIAKDHSPLPQIKFEDDSNSR